MIMFERLHLSFYYKFL